MSVVLARRCAVVPNDVLYDRRMSSDDLRTFCMAAGFMWRSMYTWRPRRILADDAERGTRRAEVPIDLEAVHDQGLWGDDLRVYGMLVEPAWNGTQASFSISRMAEFAMRLPLQVTESLEKLKAREYISQSTRVGGANECQILDLSREGLFIPPAITEGDEG